MSEFQTNLRKYRVGLGITAKDFAAKIGINYTTYANYENRGKEPKFDTLCKIAAALHVSIDELLGFEPERKNIEYWQGYLSDTEGRIFLPGGDKVIFYYGNDNSQKELEAGDKMQAVIKAELTKAEALHLLAVYHKVAKESAKATEKQIIANLVIRKAMDAHKQDFMDSLKDLKSYQP